MLFLLSHFYICSSRTLFPDGLPPSYVFVATLRYKGSVAVEEWDVWRIQSRDGKPQMAVTLNGLDRTVMFTTTSKSPSGTQTVTFSQQTAGVEYLCVSFIWISLYRALSLDTAEQCLGGGEAVDFLTLPLQICDASANIKPCMVLSRARVCLRITRGIL